MSKVSLKGVAVGGIVDIVTTNILGLPVIFHALSKLDRASIPSGQLTGAVTAAVRADVLLFSAQIVIGLAGSAVGGYVAAWIAGRNFLLNGAFSAWLCIATGIYALFAVHTGASAWWQILDFVLAPSAGLLGGYLRLHVEKVRQRALIF